MSTRLSAGGMWEAFLTWGVLWKGNGRTGRWHGRNILSHPQACWGEQMVCGGMLGAPRRGGGEVLCHTGAVSSGEAVWGGQAGKGKL